GIDVEHRPTPLVQPYHDCSAVAISCESWPRLCPGLCINRHTILGPQRIAGHVHSLCVDATSLSLHRDEAAIRPGEERPTLAIGNHVHGGSTSREIQVLDVSKRCGVANRDSRRPRERMARTVNYLGEDVESASPLMEVVPEIASLDRLPVSVIHPGEQSTTRAIGHELDVVPSLRSGAEGDAERVPKGLSPGIDALSAEGRDCRSRPISVE